MVWAKAGTDTLTGTAALDLSAITASTFNVVLLDKPSGAYATSLRFNSDSSTNYSRRYELNGGADGTNTGRTAMFGENFYHGDFNEFNVGYISNIATEEKLGMLFTVSGETAGANAPARMNIVSKWTNTAAQITSMITDGTSLPSGSSLSALGSDLTPAAAVPFPSDVQEGSRAEITDTRKVYNLTGPDTVTFEDDFNTDDWTDVGSLGVSGGTLGGDAIIDGGDDTSYKDMTSISETAFVFRFKATYITTFGSGSASRFIHFGLSDKFAPQNTTQDFVGFSFEAWNAPAFRIGGQMRNGQILDQPSNGNLRLSELDHSSAGTFTYWFEVIRNGNAFTLNVYSDSGYSTLVDSVTSTVTGITALRYFSCTNKDNSGSSTGTLNVAIDDLELYNGITSVLTSNTWQEIGT